MLLFLEKEGDIMLTCSREMHAFRFFHHQERWVPYMLIRRTLPWATMNACLLGWREKRVFDACFEGEWFCPCLLSRALPACQPVEEDMPPRMNEKAELEGCILSMPGGAEKAVRCFRACHAMTVLDEETYQNGETVCMSSLVFVSFLSF